MSAVSAGVLAFTSRAAVGSVGMPLETTDSVAAGSVIGDSDAELLCGGGDVDSKVGVGVGSLGCALGASAFASGAGFASGFGGRGTGFLAVSSCPLANSITCP